MDNSRKIVVYKIGEIEPYKCFNSIAEANRTLFKGLSTTEREICKLLVGRKKSPLVHSTLGELTFKYVYEK